MRDMIRCLVRAIKRCNILQAIKDIHPYGW
jgi:hypothetical protein